MPHYGSVRVRFGRRSRLRVVVCPMRLSRTWDIRSGPVSGLDKESCSGSRIRCCRGHAGSRRRSARGLAYRRARPSSKSVRTSWVEKVLPGPAGVTLPSSNRSRRCLAARRAVRLPQRARHAPHRFSDRRWRVNARRLTFVVGTANSVQPPATRSASLCQITKPAWLPAYQTRDIPLHCCRTISRRETNRYRPVR